MARIAEVEPEAMSPELRKLLDTRPPYVIYRVLANAPTVLPGFIQLAGALLTQTELDAQLREMVILRVVRIATRRMRSTSIFALQGMWGSARSASGKRWTFVATARWAMRSRTRCLRSPTAWCFP